MLQDAARTVVEQAVKQNFGLQRGEFSYLAILMLREGPCYWTVDAQDEMTGEAERMKLDGKSHFQMTLLYLHLRRHFSAFHAQLSFT